MDEERISSELREAICDRLFGWELVDYLNIHITDIVEAFEETILENIDDVLEFVDFKDNNNSEDE